MLLLGIGIVGALVAYYWMNKNGFSYLSFITSSPQKWMVSTLAWGSAIAVFAVFAHGMSWFGNVFSWSRKIGFGGTKGIITTILMVAMMLWVGSILIFYYGSVAEVQTAHDYAMMRQGKGKQPDVSLMQTWRSKMLSYKATDWLHTLDPFYDPERLRLAELVCYLGSFEDQAAALCAYAEMSAHFPRARRIWVLSRNKGIQSSVRQGNMDAVFNHPDLTKILRDDSSRDAIKRFPVEQFIARGTLAGSQK